MTRLNNFFRKIYNIETYDVEVKDILAEVKESNRSMLKSGALIMSVVFGCMCLLSFFTKDYIAKTRFYFLEFLISAATFVIAATLLKKKPSISLLVRFIFIASLYCYGIYVGIINQQNNLAVTACLFLAILPILFIEYPVHQFSFSTIAAIITCVLIIIMKENSIRVLDLTDAFFSWVVGLFLGLEMNKIKLDNYVQKHRIETERDTDGLTGLYNKDALCKYSNEFLENEDACGAMFIMDIDKFKNINDSLGHNYGDNVLVMLAECLLECKDEPDIIGRFGGDEYVFILPYAEKKKALERAIELQNLITKKSVRFKELDTVRVSLGIMMFDKSMKYSYDELMIRADRALYYTKKNGRYGYTFYSDEKMEIVNF